MIVINTKNKSVIYSEEGGDNVYLSLEDTYNSTNKGL